MEKGIASPFFNQQRGFKPHLHVAKAGTSEQAVSRDSFRYMHAPSADAARPSLADPSIPFATAHPRGLWLY